KVQVPLLGIVENMSYYLCPHCQQRDEIFGHGGARREAERREVPFLGEIPLFTAIRQAGDDGVPVVQAAPDSPPAQAFRHCADGLWRRLAARAGR
ncbi:P-loop NTPase, partial [bacterium]|nr:P-loop NTPase [bacterium]